jgi:heat shock protein HslJ
MPPRHFPLVALALPFALTTAACSMQDANLAPGSGAPAYVPANAAPPALSSASNDLVGPAWQWQRTLMPDGRSIVTTTPERYTLTFEGGGRVLLRADCNRGSGTYEINGNAMKMGPAALTRMGCPPGSQGSDFALLLSRVASFAVVDGELVLKLADGTRMDFRAGR